MKSRLRVLKSSLAACAILVGGMAWATPVQAQITYSGRAFGAYVNVQSFNVGPVFISDTGELPSNGEPRSASLFNLAVPPTDGSVARAELLVAHTSGANGVAESFAFVAGANVLNGLLTAKAVGARSVATCNGVQGFTEILDLKVANQPIVVDPFAQNQTFGPIMVDNLVTATLIVNEQLPNPGPGSQEITVNAVHLIVSGAVQAEVILSSARSDIHGCPGCPPAPRCDDRVTGGGWINVGNDRANFGFNAGFKGGSLDVNFNYIDHRTGMHMKATTITEYVATGPTSRRFKGSAEIDGVSGYTYEIEVADRGEPGRNTDTISIKLGNGYSAGGPLAGGNIQLHKPCP